MNNSGCTNRKFRNKDASQIAMLLDKISIRKNTHGGPFTFFPGHTNLVEIDSSTIIIRNLLLRCHVRITLCLDVHSPSRICLMQVRMHRDLNYHDLFRTQWKLSILIFQVKNVDKWM